MFVFTTFLKAYKIVFICSKCQYRKYKFCKIYTVHRYKNYVMDMYIYTDLHLINYFTISIQYRLVLYCLKTLIRTVMVSSTTAIYEGATYSYLNINNMEWVVSNRLDRTINLSLLHLLYDDLENLPTLSKNNNKILDD